MPARFPFYEAPPPANLAQQFSDYAQTTPAQGFLIAANALRESLDRRSARQFEGEQRALDRDFQARERATDRRATYEISALGRAHESSERRMDRASRLESDALDRAAQVQRANASARAQADAEALQQQDKVDEARAKLVARGVVAALVNDTSDENPYFRRAKIASSSLLYPNATEDEVFDAIMAGHSPARPYLDEKASADVKKMLGGFLKPRELILWNPANAGALQAQVESATVQQLGGGQATRGMQRGIALALDEYVDKMPTSELQAAEKERDRLQESIKGVFGTAVPAAQQSQQLQAPGAQALGAAAPAAVSIVPGDFPDDFLAGMAGSTVQGLNMKDRLGLGESLGRALPRWVPIQNADGSTYITIEGVDARDRVMIERQANNDGPYKTYLLGRLKSGGNPVTDAEAKKAGAREGSTQAPSTPAGAPAAPQRAPQTQQPTGGNPYQVIAPDLLHFLNGQPKQ